MKRLWLVIFACCIALSGTVLAQATYLSANSSQIEVTELPRLLHYLPQDMPVKVFVPVPDVAEAESQRASVEAAFLAWQQAAPDIIQFEFVDSPTEEALTVNFDASQGGVGTYRYSYEVQADGQWRFRATNLFLNPDWDTSTLYRYALVQVGHALGLLGRSPYEGDAMSMSPSGIISQRDTKTLLELYAIPSGTVLGD